MANNSTMNPTWTEFLKTHNVEHGVLMDYIRYSSMDPDDVFFDFMDCHKDWPHPVCIDKDGTTYTKMLDLICFSEEDEYKDLDLSFAPYAPVIKDCFRMFMFTAQITTPNTSLYLGMPGLVFVNQPPKGITDFAECEIHITACKDVTYKGYVYVHPEMVQQAQQAQQGYLGPITDKATALQFIKDHDDNRDFYENICNGLGYYDAWPWLAKYLPEGVACKNAGLYGIDYLDDDPVIMCIDEKLRKDPDIIAALKKTVHWPH